MLAICGCLDCEYVSNGEMDADNADVIGYRGKQHAMPVYDADTASS